MSTAVGPLSTQAGLELLQASLPSNLPNSKDKSHQPAALPFDPANQVGANPNNIITKANQLVQEEAKQAAASPGLNITT